MRFGSFSPFITVICLAAIAPLLIKCAEPTWKYEIVVSHHDGVDKTACLNGSASIPCRTLDYALQRVTNSTLVWVRSTTSFYNLTQNFTFKNVQGFGLVGEGDSIHVKCERGSLSFENSEDVNITRIFFDGCGGLHASTSGETLKRPRIPFLSAVFFVYCKNIVIDNCSIVNSTGIGVNMYDVGGDVRIMHSRFENNRPDADSSGNNIAVAGGGIYLELTYQGGTSPFDLNSSTLAEFDSNSSYTFFKCNFTRNYAPSSNQAYNMTIDKPFKEDHVPFGRGGGLSIFLRGKAQNNIIRINHCQFEDNNAEWGGGAFIEFHDEAQNNTLEMTYCTFQNNSAHKAGGGFRSGTIAQSNQGLLANKMKYENCIFENNSAIFGGGVSYYESGYPLKADDGELSTEYKNCTWKKNKATMGSAIGLSTGSFINGIFKHMDGEENKYYFIVLEDCNVTDNSIVLTEDKKVIGQGAIYSYSLPIILHNVTIEYNNNTAMVIENIVLFVAGNVTFRNNTGGQGGALGLYGTSVIMLMPHSELVFMNNTAGDRGGALYVEDSGPPVVAFNTTSLKTRGCFIAYNNSFDSIDQVAEWQSKIVFRGNKVQTIGGGDSVYASTLQGCRRNLQPRINNESLEWPNIIEYQDSDSEREISTDPIEINFIDSEWDVSPSELFDASVQLIDEKNHSVLGVVKLTIINEGDQTAAGNVVLGTVSHLFLVQGNESSKISNLHLEGKEGSSFSIEISTIDGRVVRTSSKHQSHLRPCSPGFEQTDNKTCSCISSKRVKGILNCSTDYKHVFLKRGYWGGMIGSDFSTYPCPRDYCSNITKFSNFKYSNETMCTVGRNGSSILCGACKNHYSVNLGNEECKKTCSDKYLWLALGLFCVITPLLVLIVFKINLDIFTTYLNTWLYSYQIILFLLEDGQYLDGVISFIISLANWRIQGVGTCLSTGMNNLDKLGVNYVLPVYVLLLLFVLSKIARCRPGWFVNRNVAHAFCTLLVLCYTNVTMISFNIIHYVPVHGKWVLYADGNIAFITDWIRHLPFTIVACLWILFFVAPIPLLLLFTPWFLRRIPYLNSFRLFFDTFQRCFKVQYRWFAAYYFICRIVILCIALYVPFGPLKRSILEVSSTIIAAICLYLQPYNEQYQWLNRLDAVLLTNLCLIVNFSSNVRSDVTQSVQKGLEVTVNALAYVPLVYLFVLVCYHGWKYCCPRNLDSYAAMEDDTCTSPTSTAETGASNRLV